MWLTQQTLWRNKEQEEAVKIKFLESDKNKRFIMFVQWYSISMTIFYYPQAFLLSSGTLTMNKDYAKTRTSCLR